MSSPGGLRLTGILPVAGLGMRMRPLTERLPKCLIEIGGRSLLVRAVLSLQRMGIDELVVIVGFREDLVRRTLDNLTIDLPVRLVHQQEPKGLVHALSLAKPLIAENGVLFCPDNLYSEDDDLIRAATVYRQRKPVVLQVGTLAPDDQPGRSVFDLGSMQRIEANAYRCSSGEYPWRGVSIRSTGVTFFSKRALRGLPDRFEPRERTLAQVLAEFRHQGDFLVSCLYGAREDLTRMEDVEAYWELAVAQGTTIGKGVSIILLGRDGRVLMQLRDNKPGIVFPGYWGLFGGSVEAGESPEKAMVREVAEEIKYALTDFGRLRTYIFQNRTEYAYAGLVDAAIEELHLEEGRDFGFFAPDDLKKMRIRPDDRETLARYFDWGEA